MADVYISDYTQSKYVSAYASLTAALSAIGSTPTVLRINQTTTVSSSMTIPNTCRVEIEGTAGFSIATGQVLTLPEPAAEPHQIFYGLGQARIAKSSGTGNYYGAWWIPDGSASAQTITAAMWEAMRYALYNNTGGNLIFPIGEYNYTVEPLIQIGSIIGSGNTNQSGNESTLLVQQTNGSAALRIMPGARSVLIDNLVISLGSNYNSSGILCQGEGGVDGNIDGLKIDRVTVHGGHSAYRQYDATDNGYQVMNVEITESCNFQDQKVACFWNNTVNSKGTCRAQMTPDPGAWEVWNEDCGKWVFDYHGIGVLQTPATKRFTFVSGDIASNIITETDHGIPTGTPCYVSNSGGGLPTGITAQTKYYWRSASASTGTLHTTAAYAIAGTNIMAISGGTGTQTLTTMIPSCTNFSFISTDVSTGSNTVTKASHGQVTGDAGYLVNYGGALPTGLSAATKYWLNVAGNVMTFHTTIATAFAGTSPVDITAAGSGTNVWQMAYPHAQDQPAGGMYLTGRFNPGLTITNNYKEGIPWLLHCEEIHDYSSHITMINCFCQEQLRFKNAEITLVLLGGEFLSDGIHDDADSHVKIYNFGAVPYTFGKTGDGAPYNNFAGYDTPAPHSLANFQGSSEFMFDPITGVGIASGGTFTDAALEGTTTADILEMRGTANEIDFYDRATDAGKVILYSPTAGALHFYYGGSDILRLTTSYVQPVGLTFNGRDFTRVQVLSGSATPTPDFASYTTMQLAVTTAPTFTNPVGSPAQGDQYEIYMTADGTGRAISYDTQYRAIGVTLPTVTVANKRTILQCRWNATDSKLDVWSVSQEA